MISNEKVAELGKALAEINRHYTAEDMRKILDYALENRSMLGYPHDVADMLRISRSSYDSLIGNRIGSGIGTGKRNKQPKKGSHATDFSSLVPVTRTS
jgi:hypothetical protein